MPEQELTNWEDKLSQMAKAESAVERPSVATVSFRGGVMSYMDEEVPDSKMDVVVLSSVVEHAWFIGDYDADKIVPPTCFALGEPGQEKEMVPHENVPEDQRQADTCAECPKNQWGSGKGRGKACGLKRRIGFIPATALADLESLAAAETAKASVPTTSVKRWSNYVNTAAAQYQRPPWAMVTTVQVKPDAKTVLRVMFTPKGMADGDALPILEAMIDPVHNILMEGYDMTPQVEEEEEAPASGKKKKY